MTVVTNRQGMFGNLVDSNKCSLCDEKLSYPFVEWSQGRVCICNDCCQSLGRNKAVGLVADIVQACAIKELQALGYDKFTLIRERISEVEQRCNRELTRKQAE